MYGMIMILASGGGLLDGQSLTTAALVVTTGLLIWFTKMAIKLRDQLVNSMSEIAMNVVNKFATTGAVSSTSSSVESASSSETIDGAIDGARGVAADLGIDGGDIIDDGDGGGGMGGMSGGEDVHGMFNEYGDGDEADAEAGADAGAGASSAGAASAQGGAGYGKASMRGSGPMEQRRGGDYPGTAATGSGSSKERVMSEGTAKRVGAEAMAAASLASLSGDDVPARDQAAAGQDFGYGLGGRLHARAEVS